MVHPAIWFRCYGSFIKMPLTSHDKSESVFIRKKKHTDSIVLYYFKLKSILKNFPWQKKCEIMKVTQCTPFVFVDMIAKSDNGFSFFAVLQCAMIKWKYRHNCLLFITFHQQLKSSKKAREYYARNNNRALIKWITRVMFVINLITWTMDFSKCGRRLRICGTMHSNLRPVSLCFDLQKIATEFILRLILSLYIDKYYLKNLEKSKHGKWEKIRLFYRRFHSALL